MRYLPGGVPVPIEETLNILNRRIDYWKAHDHGLWAVELKDSGQFIGQCGLLPIPDTEIIEIGYSYGKIAWGKGIGTEAASATLRYGFETVGLERILAVADPENTPSRRIMEKLGMVFEEVSDNYYGDMLAIYSVTRDQFVPDGGVYVLTL